MQRGGGTGASDMVVVMRQVGDQAVPGPLRPLAAWRWPDRQGRSGWRVWGAARGPGGSGRGGERMASAGPRNSADPAVRTAPAATGETGAARDAQPRGGRKSVSRTPSGMALNSACGTVPAPGARSAKAAAAAGKAGAQNRQQAQDGLTGPCVVKDSASACRASAGVAAITVSWQAGAAAPCGAPGVTICRAAKPRKGSSTSNSHRQACTPIASAAGNPELRLRGVACVGGR